MRLTLVFAAISLIKKTSKIKFSIFFINIQTVASHMGHNWVNAFV